MIEVNCIGLIVSDYMKLNTAQKEWKIHNNIIFMNTYIHYEYISMF